MIGARIRGFALAVTVILPLGLAMVPSAEAQQAPASLRQQSKATLGSIFDGSYPQLSGSGWSRCGGPVTWSLDTAGLPDPVEAIAEAEISWALDSWSQASGLHFEFAGREELSLTSDGTQLRPASGEPLRLRHIYMAFVPGKQLRTFESATWGLGAPTVVVPQAREIVTANAIFKRDILTNANMPSRATLRNLYLHEIGHALGLSHDSRAGMVMSPVLSERTRIAPAENTGINAITQDCA